MVMYMRLDTKEENKMTKMNEQNLMDKVQKLLSLAGNNPNEHEAQAAYAKAQALIAEYNLDMSKATGEKIEFVAKLCKHSNNEGYRKPLAVVIADNFRVKTFMRGNTVCFFGMKQDVEVAVEVFNHAYRYSHNRGLKLERQYREKGLSTHGVANSYWLGFCKGLKDILDEQCKALMIITPQEVEDEWNNTIAPTLRRGNGGVRTYGSDACYQKGYEEGKEHMRSTKSLNQ